MSAAAGSVHPRVADAARLWLRGVAIVRRYIRFVAVLAAVAFVLDAVVHAANASSYDPASGGLITEGNLFRAEAAVAALVALLLVARPSRSVWMLAFATAVTALGAVVLYRYVNVGAIGPIPNLYEPTWQVPGKLLSAYAEASAAVISGVGAIAARTRA